MLECLVEFRKGILFVRLIGQLNKYTVPKLEREVIDIIKNIGINNVVFNIQYLSKIDLKGVNSLLYAYELCKKNNGSSLMCGLNNKVNGVIKYNRLLNYIKQTDNELSAFDIVKI